VCYFLQVAVPAFKHAFPHGAYAPSSFTQQQERLSIVTLVSANLGSPKFRTCTGPFEKWAVMAMPEAAMYKDDSSVARKDDVGFTGEATGVKTETETGPMKKTPDCNLRLRVCSAYTCHHAATRSAIYNVSHS